MDEAKKRAKEYSYELFKITSNTHNGVYRYITTQNSKLPHLKDSHSKAQLINETKMTLFMANKSVHLPCSESLLILKTSIELDPTLKGIVVDFGISKIAELSISEIHDNILPISYSLQYVTKRVLFDYVLTICLRSYEVLNSFYWNLSYLKHQLGQPYNIYEFLFESKLQETIEGQIYRRRLRKAETLLTHFKTIGEAAKTSPGKTKDKEKVVNSLIGSLKITKEIVGIYFPIETSFKISKTCTFTSTVLKSAMFPILYQFNSLERNSIYNFEALKTIPDKQNMASPNSLSFIFKTGDSVHKDHLVMFLFSRMDKILKNSGITTKLQLYNINPVFRDSGLVQFIPGCINLAQIASEYKTIKAYFESIKTDVNKARKNFSESMAFYTVACYILAIGDRHKDNILIKRDGTAFHIDFSYILGADPKPYAPLVKVTEEMVEFIDEDLVSAYVTEEELFFDGTDVFGNVLPGGKRETPFIKFLRRCVVIYNALRKNSTDILNIIQLAKNAYEEERGLNINKNECKLDNLEIRTSLINVNKINIPFNIVMNRFKLDLNDMEAGKHICGVIITSIHAFMPKVMDKFHDWAQAWR